MRAHLRGQGEHSAAQAEVDEVHAKGHQGGHDECAQQPPLHQLVERKAEDIEGYVPVELGVGHAELARVDEPQHHAPAAARDASKDQGRDDHDEDGARQRQRPQQLQRLFRHRRDLWAAAVAVGQQDAGAGDGGEEEHAREEEPDPLDQDGAVDALEAQVAEPEEVCVDVQQPEDQHEKADYQADAAAPQDETAPGDLRRADLPRLAEVWETAAAESSAEAAASEIACH